MDVYHDSDVYLNPDRSPEDREATLNLLLLNAACGRALSRRLEHRVPGENPTCPTEDPGLLSALNQSIPTTQVTPKPGFCIKTKNSNKGKVFINICTAEHVDFNMYDLLMLPQCKGNNHWVLLVASVMSRTVFIYDSLGGNNKALFDLFCQFMCQRVQIVKGGLEKFSSEFKAPPCNKQRHGDSCGVFALMVPAPKEMSDEDLIKLLYAEERSDYRIPMSIGEPHAEMDDAGRGCTAYDVVVSPEFMQKMEGSGWFRMFFVTVMMEGLECKYDIELGRGDIQQPHLVPQSGMQGMPSQGPSSQPHMSSMPQYIHREWIILKNRKFVGTIQVQNVRTKSKPFIMEMGKQNEDTPKKPGFFIQEVTSSAKDIKSKGKEPDYCIVQEPPEGHSEFLVAEINLPNVKVCSSISLDLGEDRILLQTRSNTYYLDIYIPFFIVQAECGAQFNRKTRILTITMPVQPLT